MAEEVARFAAHVRGQMARVVVGQSEAIQQLLLVLLCAGHALIEGVPGLAKTLAVRALARVGGLDFRRVQCTPDLMPADMLGTSVFNLQTGAFSLHRGPIFTDLLLVDEINRTPPRTQSALLEAMQERQATIDGQTHPLSEFFSVFATQNPIEFEGTYPLPEAQLDRFLLKIRMGYPAAQEETEILEHHAAGFDARELDRLELEPLPKGWLSGARSEVSGVRVEPALLGYATNLIRRSRDWVGVSLGGSPRAGVNLLLAAKAAAALDGRDFLLPDDVKTVAPAVLRHRLLLKPEADLEGVTPDQVIADLLASIEVPK
jgi:MoxR-like ATPase